MRISASQNRFKSLTLIDIIIQKQFSYLGHEMAFVMFVCCLFKIGLLTEEDKAAVGLKLFKTYFDLGKF